MNERRGGGLIVPHELYNIVRFDLFLYPGGDRDTRVNVLRPRNWKRIGSTTDVRVDCQFKLIIFALTAVIE